MESDNQSPTQTVSVIRNVNAPTSVSVSIVSVLAAVVVVSFWLPWFKLLGISASGAAFAQSSNGNKLVWLIPFMGLATIFIGFTRSSQRGWAQITGVLPILGVLYCIESDGAELIFQVLDVGAYIAVGAGILLILSPYFRSSRPS